MQSREHHRVHLRFPVRLRWACPFGRREEVCETLDVSRGGLLIACREIHAPGLLLWVAFPYDLVLAENQPDLPARVVWSCIRNGVEPRAAVAIQFSVNPRGSLNGTGGALKVERRVSPRRVVATRVNVRPEGVAWFEETMTFDVSAEGVRFLSTREFERGNCVFVSFTAPALASWSRGREYRCLVVRTQPIPENPALSVSVRRIN